jgi:hypothetical protein
LGGESGKQALPWKKGLYSVPVTLLALWNPISYARIQPTDHI